MQFFFACFFFTITYLVLLYLRDILLLTEKGLWSLNLPGANYFLSILTILFVKTFICLTSKILVILLKLYRCMVFFWNLFISIAGTNTIHFTFNHNLTIPGLYLGSEQCPRKLIS